MVAQRLPMEIILHIIDSIIDDPARIYTPHDDVTKTLLSFTRVCRATYAHASNHLRRQCMYIDDDVRLADCVDYLQATNHLVPEYNDGKIEDAQCASPRARLCPITSMYLAPFYDEDNLHDEHNLYENYCLEQTFSRIADLCTLVGSSLASLILDIPDWALQDELADGYPDLDDTYAREPLDSIVSNAFSCLTELRDFVCVRALFIQYFQDSVTLSWTLPSSNEVIFPWDFWPKLQRLALHGQSADGYFWHSVRTARNLHTLILIKPTLLNPGCQKTAFLRNLPTSPYQTGIGTVDPPRPIKIVDVEYSSAERTDKMRQKLLSGASNWPLIDPDNLIKLRLCNLPVIPTRETGIRSHVAYPYIASAAIRGEIWGWEGEIIS